MSAFCTKREGFFFFFMFSRFKKAAISFFTYYFSSNLKRSLYLNFLLASEVPRIVLPSRYPSSCKGVGTLENEVPRHGVLGLRARLAYLKLDSVVHYHRSIHCLPYFYLGRYLEEEEEEKRIISKRNFCRNNY